MHIDEALLDQLEKMAMIQIDEDKREEFKAQLSEILNFVDNLKSIPTDDISIPCREQTPLREDEIKHAHVQSSVLSHAPCAEDGFFIVPRII